MRLSIAFCLRIDVSILVLTEEGTYEEAMELPEGEKPAFIFPSLAEVDEALFEK